jgi:TM2 domain-containing membrane protein YozV
MDCPKCGTSNDEENRFCTTCASPLYEASTTKVPESSVTPTYAPASVTPKKYIQPSGKKEPLWMAIASGLIPGVGQIIIGQITKGALLLVASCLLICSMCFTSGISILPYLLLCGFSAYDAFKITEKLNGGQEVGEMEFFFQNQGDNKK